MMTTHNIEYIGCPMSGRSTSWREVLRSCDAVEMIEQNLFAADRRGRKVRIGGLRQHAQINLTKHREPAARRELERLREAHGVIFVLDSQTERLDGNAEAYEGLLEQLLFLRRPLADLSIVFQANKRDLGGVADLETMQRSLGVIGGTWVETVAVRGIGVLESFDEMMALLHI